MIIPKVSIIVPTYNGLNKVKAIIPCLENQSATIEELLFVIDGSTDGTLEFLENYVSSLPLRFVYQANKGRAAVRNRGAKEAKGELLIFFDDDTLPATDCVQSHIDHHLRIGNTACVGECIDKITKDSKDFQWFKYSLVLQWNNQLSQQQPLPKENILIAAANFSISKELFFKLGAFDEKLNDAEDLDLAIRCYLSNTPIYYLNSAKAIHVDNITCKSYITRQLSYKKYISLLFEMRGEAYNEFKNQRAFSPSFPKSLIFRLLRRSIFSTLVDNEFFKFLPKGIRYKLYNMILTAPLV